MVACPSGLERRFLRHVDYTMYVLLVLYKEVELRSKLDVFCALKAVCTSQKQ